MHWVAAWSADTLRNGCIVAYTDVLPIRYVAYTDMLPIQTCCLYRHVACADSAAAGGADLLGLGYTSDGDSQDSAPKFKPIKSETVQSEAIPSALQADSEYHPSDKRDPSMSPETAAGGWVKQEEEDGRKVDTAAKPFVKGQRCGKADLP